MYLYGKLIFWCGLCWWCVGSRWFWGYVVMLVCRFCLGVCWMYWLCRCLRIGFGWFIFGDVRWFLLVRMDLFWRWWCRCCVGFVGCGWFWLGCCWNIWGWWLWFYFIGYGFLGYVLGICWFWWICLIGLILCIGFGRLVWCK